MSVFPYPICEENGLIIKIWNAIDAAISEFMTEDDRPMTNEYSCIS